MKNLYTANIDQYRLTGPAIVSRFGWTGDDTCGYFSVPSPIDGAPMNVIASAGFGWDHVSVSRANRCPNWPEMSHIKKLFFEDHEPAMQLHVPAEDYVNFHPNCLHLWRPNDGREIPRPPSHLVGPKEEKRRA